MEAFHFLIRTVTVVSCTLRYSTDEVFGVASIVSEVVGVTEAGVEDVSSDQWYASSIGIVETVPQAEKQTAIADRIQTVILTEDRLNMFRKNFTFKSF